MSRVFNENEQRKLKSLVTEGVRTLGEIEVLNAGLNDTIKAIAEELELKPAVLKKAVKTAHKANFHKERDNYDTLETILETVGRTE